MIVYPCKLSDTLKRNNLQNTTVPRQLLLLFLQILYRYGKVILTAVVVK